MQNTSVWGTRNWRRAQRCTVSSRHTGTWKSRASASRRPRSLLPKRLPGRVPEDRKQHGHDDEGGRQEVGEKQPQGLEGHLAERVGCRGEQQADSETVQASYQEQAGPSAPAFVGQEAVDHPGGVSRYREYQQ